MDDHLGILEKRVQTGAVGAKRAIEKAEGIRSEIDEREEEDLNCCDDYGGVREKAGIRFVAKAKNEAIGGEQKRPEDQGTFLSGPQRGELIFGVEVAIAVMKDVSNREIIAEGGDYKAERGQKYGGKYDDAGAAGGLSQSL